MTATLFKDWILNYFVDAVANYNKAKNLSNKALLIIDNAPSHIIDNIEVPDNIQIIFLPPNTTPLIQPMDQGVISNFKAYYLRRIFQNLIRAVDSSQPVTIKEFWKQHNILNAIKLISEAWQEVKESCMNGVWKKIWPQCVRNLEVTVGENNDVQNEIVSLARGVGMDNVETEDVAELINFSEENLSNEELIMLVNEQGKFQLST